MDSIKSLTMQELIKIAYENRCFKCLDTVYDYGDGNYWDCSKDCGRKCCDTCKEAEDQNSGKSDDELDDEEIEGYCCEHCHKNEKKTDDSK